MSSWMTATVRLSTTSAIKMPKLPSRSKISGAQRAHCWVGLAGRSGGNSHAHAWSTTVWHWCTLQPPEVVTAVGGQQLRRQYIDFRLLKHIDKGGYAELPHSVTKAVVAAEIQQNSLCRTVLHLLVNNLTLKYIFRYHCNNSVWNCSKTTHYVFSTVVTGVLVL